MIRASVVVFLVLCAFAAVQARRNPFANPTDNLDYGVVPKNFFRSNASSPLDTLDVQAALQGWGSSYCAPSGGYSQIGTGPWCQSSCSNCVCNEQGDGSYTWCGYPYQCFGYMWGYESMDYGNYTYQPGTPFVISETFNNDLNVSQSFTFSKQASYSNTYSWTQTTTVSDTISIEVSATIPDICSVKDTFSTTISLTNSSTQSKTNTQQWTVSQTFTVPPNTSVVASMMIETAQYTLPYNAVIKFQGMGMVWCNDRVNDHYLWFPYASSFLNFGGCYSDDGMDAICPLSGTFYGLQGVNANVTIKQNN